VIEDLLKLSLGSIAGSMPSESFTIKEIVEGRRTVRLKDGSVHEISQSDVDRVAQKIPSHLWGLVRLPFVVLKTLGVGTYRIGGDKWAVRAINVLLERKGEEETLNSIEVERLLKEFRSLTFIGIGIDNISIEEDK
jgi:Protein of unknown function DUF61.